MTSQEFAHIRRSLGLSRREFAQRIGCGGSRKNHFKTISRYEENGRDIPAAVAERARALIGSKDEKETSDICGRGGAHG